MFDFLWALREEKEEKVKITKEIKVKGDLFRISKYRRENITEEEILISKEKKICLFVKEKLEDLVLFVMIVVPSTVKNVPKH